MKEKVVSCIECKREFCLLGIAAHVWKVHGEGRFRKRGKNKNPSSLKGKSYEEIYGKEKAQIRIAKSKMQTGINTWERMSHEKQEQARQQKRAQIHARYATGWLPKAGRCKKITYISPIAGKISVDGSWELLAAKYFDFMSFSWKRNTKRFNYINLKGEQSYYIPDFYIENWKCFIEVKGYETDLDFCKWKQFKEKLLIWQEEKINAISKILKLVGGQDGNALVC